MEKIDRACPRFVYEIRQRLTVLIDLLRPASATRKGVRCGNQYILSKPLGSNSDVIGITRRSIASKIGRQSGRFTEYMEWVKQGRSGRQLPRALMLLALASLSCNATHAADIELLEQSIVISSQDELLDLNATYSEALNFVTSLPDDKRAITKSEVKEKYGWLVEPGFSGDGAHTYETMHMPAAWFGLQTGRVVKISGQIERGDADRLESILKKSDFMDCETGNHCPFNNVISFDSPGGNFAEAIRIADFIRRWQIITVIERNQRCESACILPFMAGYTSYDGFFFPRRFAHESAKLGVHRPFIQLPEGSYSSDAVSQIVDVVNKALNEVTGFFIGAGVSLRTLERMYSTDSDNMYFLSPNEMAQEAVFVFGETASPAELVRETALAYCASAYSARYGSDTQALLKYLRSDERTFLTFEPGRNFVCMIVRESESSEWRVSICDQNQCLLSKYGQAQVYSQVGDGVLDDIATFIDNGEIGIAMRDYAHRTALLEYVRMFARDESYAFKKLPASAFASRLPQSYCGQLDTSDAGLIRVAQAALNTNGFDVGEPDGSAGPNTRKGFAKANKRLTGRDNDKLDQELLSELGVQKQEYERFRLCAD